MATKKVAPKKAAKPAKPAKSAGAKSAARPAAKTAVAAKKPVPKTATKAGPAKKAAAKTAKPAAKPVAKPAVKAPVPKKAVPQAAKKTASVPVKAPVVAKVAPLAKEEPTKKPVVETPTQQATKPLETKPAPKEPAKLVIPKTTTDKKIKYEPDFTRSVLDAQKQRGENGGPTMRYSDAELAEFRDLINRKLDVAKKELAYLQGLITRKDESGDLDEGRYMTMEDGSMSMEREQLSQMASRQIQFIDHLEKALMRIENKTYGICRVTGKLIDKARLRAVPHATLSIEAKMMNK